MIDFDFSPLWISLKTAGLATVVTFFLGIFAARWMLGYRGKARGMIDGILILPLVLPPTVVGFLLLLLLGKNSPIGQLLNQFGINIIFTWVAAVITSVVVSFPLMYRTSLGAFEQIEHNILLASRTLGASEWTIFWQVMLPLAYRGIIAATILTFARALGEFGATLMLAGNIPGQTQTMSLAIFFATESGDYQNALIWVLILLSISLSVIIAVNFWVQSRGVSKQKVTRTLGEIQKQETQNPKPKIQNSTNLFVDIEKCYPDFCLKVTLENSSKPLGIIGASGSGKSMTLRCIAGLETPDKGYISINGRVWFDSRRKINIPSYQRRVGFVFQNYALFPHLTIWQNIAFGLRKLPLSEQKKRIEPQIAQMQLQGLENRYPYQLSGGQQQRVALARALAIEPEVLLLDEPLSALDTYLRNHLEQILSEVLVNYQGVTLFVTHKLEEAYRICDNLLVLSAGTVIACDCKKNIFERPTSFGVAQVTECKNFSQIQIINTEYIEALDWNCILKVVEPIPKSITHVGFRAHHFKFSENLYQENTFPCWLVKTSETQHRMTLYLCLNNPLSENPKSYHLQAEVFKEKWYELKSLPQPWNISLDSRRIILLEN